MHVGTSMHIYIHLHYITLHYITLHYTTLHCIALHCIALHYITLHYTTLHCIALDWHWIGLHCIAFALHCTLTLHYITYIHTKSYKIHIPSHISQHVGGYGFITSPELGKRHPYEGIQSSLGQHLVCGKIYRKPGFYHQI